MQWNNFNEAAMLHLPTFAHRQKRSTNSQLSEQAQCSGSHVRSHLPPNVMRPPGMQPLVLRTTAPRILTSIERLRHFQRQLHFNESNTSFHNEASSSVYSFDVRLVALHVRSELNRDVFF